MSTVWTLLVLTGLPVILPVVALMEGAHRARVWLAGRAAVRRAQRLIR